MCFRKVTALVIMAVVGSGIAWSAGQQTAPAAQREGGEVVTVLTGGWFNTNYEAVRSTSYIAEQTDTVIRVISTAWTDYLARQQILMASGDYPEIMVINDNGRELEFATSGVLLPLNNHWGRYPNIRASRDEDTWGVMRHPDGNVYAVPTSQATGDGTPMHQERFTLYRQDWLDEYGLSIPTTVSEYLEMARFIVSTDPDGTGVFAIGGRDAELGWFDHIFTAFGVRPNMWLERNGEIISGTVAEGMEDALRLLNQMWNEGLIDPEWITDNPARWRQKLVTGLHAMPYTFGHIIDSNNVSGGYYQEFKDSVPHGSFTIGTMLTAPGYEDVAFGGDILSRRGWMRTSIVSRAPNVQAALRVLDFATSDAGTMLYNYGLEGDHYDVRADGSVDFFATEEQIAEFGINLRHLPIVRTVSWGHATPEYQAFMKEWNQFREGDATDMFLIPEVARYQPELRDYTNRELVKFIVGDNPIDGGFEQFVREYNRRGGEQLSAALNAAHKAR